MIAQADYLGFRLIPHRPSGKTLIARERALLPCGCYVAIGIIMGTEEGGSAAMPCSNEHASLIERFQRSWRYSVEHEPSARPAIDVAVEYLSAAAEGKVMPS